jgi:hypothetical protein
MKKKFIVILGLVCLAILLFFVFKNDNGQVDYSKNIESISDNTASVSDNTESVTDSTAPKTKTMYRILEFNGDTTVWDSADCVIRDSSFSCKKEIIQDLSDIVNKKFINKIHEDFSSIYKNMSILDEALENHKKNKTGNTLPSSHIKENSTNIPNNNTKQPKVIYKDLNFGKDAIVNYIPIADIPAFDRNNVAKFFSYISGKPCSKLLTFRSNYKIEAIGLPDYFKWKTRDADEMYIRKDSTEENVCITSRQKIIRGKVRIHPISIHPIRNDFFNQSRQVVDIRYLPKEKVIYEYKLLNTSILYKDTTFSWKLVYRDQYGRGDTLDITTKFEVTQNQTYTKCFDSTIERSLTKDTLFYRILDFKGDTTIWLPSDCKIFADHFSCIRRESVPKGKQCNFPNNKDNSANTTYKNLNFGKEAITNYIPVANIPDFNRDSVAKVFSVLPNTSCSALLTFKSNYSIEPIGLPKDFEWQKNFPKAVVKEISKKKKMCTLEYRRASKRPDPYEEYHNIIFEELPEKARVYNYQLFNKSLRSYKDSTITWKLVYKDQYGRGDTLDITTKFE